VPGAGVCALASVAKQSEARPAMAKAVDERKPSRVANCDFFIGRLPSLFYVFEEPTFATPPLGSGCECWN
jgi:hypothetical protein